MSDGSADGRLDTTRTQRIKLALTPSLVTTDSAGGIVNTSKIVGGAASCLVERGGGFQAFDYLSAESANELGELLTRDDPDKAEAAFRDALVPRQNLPIRFRPRCGSLERAARCRAVRRRAAGRKSLTEPAGPRAPSEHDEHRCHLRRTRQSDCP